MTDKIILGFLKNKELTAYDIKKGMEKSTSFFYSSSLGSINPALKKLEQDKQLSCNEVIENHRLKKYYKITKLGEQKYFEWLIEPINIGRIKEQALVRLFFLGDLNKQMQTDLIKKYLKELNIIINDLKQMKNEAEKNKIKPKDLQKAKFQFATLDFGLEYYKFTSTWFSNLLKKISNEN